MTDRFGEPKNVDECKKLLPLQVANEVGEVVLNHGSGFASRLQVICQWEIKPY
jgi:hypothetical protein